MAKKCRLCQGKVTVVDYKDIALLKGFVNERGKILPGRYSGLCAQHQRKLSRAVKQAREVALLPYEVK